MDFETPRLLMRSPVEADFPFVAAYQSTPAYQQFYDWEPPLEPRSRELFDQLVRGNAELPRTRHHWVVVERATGTVIGMTGVRIDVKAHNADFGYELDPSRWRQGLGLELAGATSTFAFRKLRAHRLAAEVVVDNPGSVRILEKLGFRREAYFREKESFKGRTWDVAVYALLRPEWESAGSTYCSV